MSPDIGSHLILTSTAVRVTETSRTAYAFIRLHASSELGSLGDQAPDVVGAASDAVEAAADLAGSAQSSVNEALGSVSSSMGVASNFFGSIVEGVTSAKDQV